MKKLALSLAIIMLFAALLTACSGKNGYIGVEKAKQVAFENAGVSEGEIRDLDVELDRDRGVEVYDISFDINGYEYEYEVDAETGEIFRSHRELDDVARLPAATTADDTLNTELVTDEVENIPGETEPTSEPAPATEDTPAEPAPVSTQAPEPIPAPAAVPAATETAPVNEAAPVNEPAPVNAPAPANEPVASAAPQQTFGEYISMEQAKEAALNHAGLSESDVWDLSVELDRERGVTVYDVGFDTEGYDYDYEIDAYTGDVLRYDRERENNRRPTTNANTSELITRDSAKSIALKHAGLAESDVRELEVELDRERSTDVYDVSFKSGGYEYDYEINAVTGEIIRSEKEWD